MFRKIVANSFIPAFFSQNSDHTSSCSRCALRVLPISSHKTLERQTQGPRFDNIYIHTCLNLLWVHSGKEHDAYQSSMLLHSFIKEPVVILIMVFAPKGNKVRKTRGKRLGINVRYMFLMSNKATIQECSKEGLH